jgi:mannose/fructose/N-acetylgalactosamine-specific phosphotransferase system component IIC
MYPDLGFACAIAIVAEMVHRNERIAFFILGFYFLLMLL